MSNIFKLLYSYVIIPFFNFLLWIWKHLTIFYLQYQLNLDTLFKLLITLIFLFFVYDIICIIESFFKAIHHCLLFIYHLLRFILKPIIKLPKFPFADSNSNLPSLTQSNEEISTLKNQIYNLTNEKENLKQNLEQAININMQLKREIIHLQNEIIAKNEKK